MYATIAIGDKTGDETGGKTEYDNRDYTIDAGVDVVCFVIFVFCVGHTTGQPTVTPCCF